ncbi:MAG: hypothetical protein JO077_10100 [Verrucomicrobia bacterium]|nr:hypothetical protein [Verrucomicrobiota bacterium]
MDANRGKTKTNRRWTQIYADKNSGRVLEYQSNGVLERQSVSGALPQFGKSQLRGSIASLRYSSTSLLHDSSTPRPWICVNLRSSAV